MRKARPLRFHAVPLGGWHSQGNFTYFFINTIINPNLYRLLDHGFLDGLEVTRFIGNWLINGCSKPTNQVNKGH